MNLCDLHTHTVASGHAYSSLTENIRYAKKKGLKVMGTTDHSMAMPGVETNMIFHNYGAIPRMVDDVMVLCGAEANIIDYEGALDVNLDLRLIEYAIVSLHKHCIQPGTIEENTQALIQATKHPKVKIIGHPDDDLYPVDYETLVNFAVENHYFVEVNNSSLREGGPRKGARKNLTRMLTIGKEKGLRVIMSSDAHIDLSIGEISLAEALLEELSYPKEWILNYVREPKDILAALGIKEEK
ncbi:phosphatase [Peptoniphilus sp. KCTC 25270]|uniref:phosphatase n=1 Tax=Peptoniphilus sp. KCTC 25270 TaxID=2897414 RepID=UPI001E4C3B7F|nr:phosphatase [Peptoniphilus sp. KCTC 25270]MCD1146711.1 phosphatase [Peptoniphilus sp. KCTC 25270]